MFHVRKTRANLSDGRGERSAASHAGAAGSARTQRRPTALQLVRQRSQTLQVRQIPPQCMWHRPEYPAARVRPAMAASGWMWRCSALSGSFVVGSWATMSMYIAVCIARAIWSAGSSEMGSKSRYKRWSWCRVAAIAACMLDVALLGFVWVVCGRILGYYEHVYRGLHRPRDLERWFS